MKIKDFKELKEFIKLCRSLGIDHVKVDGMEFHLATIPNRKRRAKDTDLVVDPMAYANVPTPNIKEETLPTPEQSLKDMAKAIAEEGLTPEQLLFYSTQDSPQ